MKKIWTWIKRIFLVILIIHVCWFLFFVFTLSEAIEIKDSKQTLVIVIVAIIILALVYFFWLRKIKPVKKISIGLWNVVFAAYILSFIYFLAGFLFNPPITLTQVGSLLQGNGLSRDYISYDEMGPNIKLAVIASEDQLFPDHDGFDLKAIKRAIKYNQRHPNKVRGASTISQQTAKNIFLWQGRSKLRKGLEMFYTFTIETGWTKRTILERYLNIAEMGRGIFGVQAAAKKYFNKDAKDLTMAEAAQIAACLPNPKLFTVKPLSRYVAGRYDNIMRQMGNLVGDADVQAIIK
ncbi:MAG: monofunctional biosynthetic peptidoglycan transglycosylase [Chitinophagaceae bacterium]|nr:monofunctional biosynthetic peptidoglycan transglycosylase [Chitinophagaceae bacterium]